MKNRSDIYKESNKIIIEINNLKIEVYIIFVFEENKDTYIAVTDGLEIVWLLKEVESEKSNKKEFAKYTIVPGEEMNIFVKELKEYFINNNILGLDNKTNLAQILDEELLTLEKEISKNEN